MAKRAASNKATDAATPERGAKATTPDLGALADAYDIVGELRASAHTRGFIGRRRRDGADVVITVARPPADGGNNALSHYAADVKLLSEQHHPHVVPVYEARWIGTDALAVVSARVQGDSLDDLIDRGDRLSNPRIASVLQDVLGVLEWARRIGVVHRAVQPGNLFFETSSQRVMVALAPAPIPITGADETGDARTIGALAWTMLTGKGFDRDAAQAHLGELEPNLALRVVDATERLVRSKLGEEVPDVSTVISIIAAGDVLKQAEVEIAAMKEEYQEQHRAELAKCENQRLAVEQEAAEAAATLEEERSVWHRQVSDKATELSDARADLDRVMAERQAQLATVRAELEKQAEELERRLDEFDARRLELERTIIAHGGLGPAPVAPIGLELNGREHRKPNEIRRMFAPLDAPPSSDVPVHGSRRGRWVPAVIAVAALAVAGAVIAFQIREHPRAGSAFKLGRTTVNATAPNIDQRAPSRGGFFSQSAPGSVAPKTFQPNAAASKDSTSAHTPVADTTPAAPPPSRPQTKPKPANVDAAGGMTAPSPNVETHRETNASRDSVARPDSGVRADTTTSREPRGRDSVVLIRGTRLDTIPRSNMRSESLRRERPDSIRIRPDSVPPQF